MHDDDSSLQPHVMSNVRLLSHLPLHLARCQIKPTPCYWMWTWGQWPSFQQERSRSSGGELGDEPKVGTMESGDVFPRRLDTNAATTWWKRGRAQPMDHEHTRRWRRHFHWLVRQIVRGWARAADHGDGGDEIDGEISHGNWAMARTLYDPKFLGLKYATLEVGP